MEREEARYLARELPTFATQVLSSRWRREVPHRVRCGPTDAEISKAVFHHDIGIVEVATINDDGITKGLVEPVDIQGGEFGPIGQDEQSVGVVRCSISIGHVTEIGTGGKDLLGALDRCGVIGGDGTTFRKQHFDDIDRRRLPNVIGLPFEGKAEDADTFAAEGPQGGADFIEEALFLLTVDFLDFGEEIEVDAQLLCDGTKGSYVLGKA